MSLSQVRTGDRRRIPEVDELEIRCLLSTAPSSQASRVAVAWHKYHQYVSELQRIELKSQATPAESQALSDAARTIGADAAVTSGPSAQARSTAVSLQLDQAPLYGWMGDSAWSVVQERLTKNLDGLQVPPAAIDQAIAAMRAVARSAGVSSADYQSLTAKEASYERARSSARNTTAHLPDPETYYTQHLRGFFRGGTDTRKQAEATLNADVQSITNQANDTAAERGVVQRDVQLLQQIGATLTSQADDALGTAFVAAFDHGAPDGSAQAALGAQIQAIVGANASEATRSAVDRLIADVDALYPAVGSAQENVRTIVADVQVVVANGGGAALNPFKIQIARGVPSPGSAHLSA